MDRERFRKVPYFLNRLKWFRDYRQQNGFYAVIEEMKEGGDILLSLTPAGRLQRMLRALLDEREFLSDHGIRSLSKVHEKPYTVQLDGKSTD